MRARIQRPAVRAARAVALDGEREADRAAEQAMGGGAAARARGPVQQRRSSGGGGRPLDPATRSFFEGRFGAHFGDVRVHAGGAAGEAARASGARAVTVGDDIAFDGGEYRPETHEGRALIAHELAHTLQPAGPARPKLRVNPGVELNTEGFSVTRTGDTYTGARITQSSLRNEIFSGLFASPRTFMVFGTTSAEANQNVERQVAAREGVVAFAGKKRYAFGAGFGSFRMNPRFWDVRPSGWRTKPGVNRSDAVADLNVHPDAYAIACEAATELTMEGGSKSPLAEDQAAGRDDWIPGEAGYVENTRRNATTRIGLEGENIISTGRSRFWGHLEAKQRFETLDEWVADVNSFNSPPGGAAVLGLRRRPTAGIL
jgi:hypothetical protein